MDIVMGHAHWDVVVVVVVVQGRAKGDGMASAFDGRDIYIQQIREM